MYTPTYGIYLNIKYIRYADDFILFVIGRYEYCLINLLKTFLLDNCGLTLNEVKSLITLLTKA